LKEIGAEAVIADALAAAVKAAVGRIRPDAVIKRTKKALNPVRRNADYVPPSRSRDDLPSAVMVTTIGVRLEPDFATMLRICAVPDM
jgi:hypothetical protein